MMPVSKSFFKTALLTGLIAGILDLAGATISFMITNGRFPKKILEFIAGGAFGPGAMNEVPAMKLWGLLFHFFIAVVFAFVYFFIYPKVKFFQKNIFLSAVLYGLFVWAVMNMLVLPLSAYHSPVIPTNIKETAKGAFILMLCIGLPVAAGARLYHRKNISKIK